MDKIRELDGDEESQNDFLDDIEVVEGEDEDEDENEN